MATGAISLWGRVSDVDPHHLVMPLTVEPSKPSLCNNNRFLNLWMVDHLFTLGHLSQLPLYVSKDSYQIVCDDKSGYDRILLSAASRTYFGFKWGSLLRVTQSHLVGNCLCSCTTPRVYWSATTSVLSTSCVHCISTTDTHRRFVSRQAHKIAELNVAFAKIACFIVCYTLIQLCYPTSGFVKCLVSKGLGHLRLRPLWWLFQTCPR